MHKLPARLFSCSALLALVLATPFQSLAAEAPPLNAMEINAGVYLLSGGGGANSSMLTGPEGVFLVDSKLDTDSADAIVSMIAGLTDQPVRYLANTHVHPDHTGGNEVLGAMGVPIIGHTGVREVLAAGQRGGPPAPEVAMPNILFGDNSGLEFFLNGETIRIHHMPPSHTTDNSMVQFVNANVFHLGDLYSPSRYPVMAGGTLQGFIDAMDQVLELANEDSRFIPGVGEVTAYADIVAFRDMLVTVHERLQTMIDDGATLEEIQAAGPTGEFDDTWGAPDHPLFLPAAFRQMTEAQ